MKKTGSFLVALLVCACMFADMPGNKPREAVVVYVRLGDVQGYTIYSIGPYAAYGEDKQVNDLSEILLNGGYGEPPCVTFFGINAQGRYTDSLFICNEEQGNVALTLSVVGGRLIPVMEDVPVKDEIVPVSESDTDSSGSEPETPVRALLLMSFASVALLMAWFFFTRRNKEAL